MKKISSITIAIMLIMSLVFMTTAFAKEASSDEATTVPTSASASSTQGLDAKSELEIKQAVVDLYSLDDIGLTTDDVTIEYFGTLSDGGVLVRYHFTGKAVTALMINDTIGNYNYNVSASQEVYLYKNNAFYSVKDAYDTGVINDSVLDEIAVILNFTSANITNDTTAPNVNDETKPQSTPDNVSNGNNKNNSDNSAVQTGQNDSYTFALIAVALISAGALITLKRRRV